LAEHAAVKIHRGGHVGRGEAEIERGQNGEQVSDPGPKKRMSAVKNAMPRLPPRSWPVPDQVSCRHQMCLPPITSTFRL
jgi:hypothetical protein